MTGGGCGECPACQEARQANEAFVADILDMFVVMMADVDGFSELFDSTGQPTQELTPDNLPEVIRVYFERVAPETDRGCVLVSVSYLEELLRRLLRAAFVASDSRVDRFADEMRLAERTDLAFSMGLIPREAREDLHRIRKVRNRVAHDWGDFSFSDPAIAGELAKLHHDPVREPISGRRRFMRTTAVLAGEIDHRRRAVARPSAPSSRALQLMREMEQSGFTLDWLRERYVAALNGAEDIQDLLQTMKQLEFGAPPTGGAEAESE